MALVDPVFLTWGRAVWPPEYSLPEASKRASSARKSTLSGGRGGDVPGRSANICVTTMF